jgi:hypothetical protein
MYAVVSTVNIQDPERARAALTDLRLRLVPQPPGFVSAYWLAPIDRVGSSVMVSSTPERTMKMSERIRCCRCRVRRR